MSNPKADWSGRNDQGVRRLLENYRNDPESIEHRAASGKRRKTPAGCSGEGQAVLCVQTAKKRPFSLTQNQPPKTGKVDASACPSHSAQMRRSCGNLSGLKRPHIGQGPCRLRRNLVGTPSAVRMSSQRCRVSIRSIQAALLRFQKPELAIVLFVFFALGSY